MIASYNTFLIYTIPLLHLERKAAVLTAGRVALMFQLYGGRTAVSLHIWRCGGEGHIVQKNGKCTLRVGGPLGLWPPARLLPFPRMPSRPTE